jgi:hypothetical protein
MATPIDFTMLGGRLTMMWEPEPTGLFKSEEANNIVLQMEKVLRNQIADDIAAYMANYYGDFEKAITPVLISIAKGEKQ